VESEPLPDLSTLSDDELTKRIRVLETEEDSISFRRRVLHGRIDILRGEYVSRLREQVADEGTVAEFEPEPLLRSIFEGTGDVPEGRELAPLPDLTSLSDAELRGMVRELEREEDDISLRRRFLHGQIDILRAARYERLRSGSLDVSELVRVLTGHVEGDGEAGPGDSE
jgi:hypothetical protein